MLCYAEYMDYFAHTGHDHGTAHTEVAAASTSGDSIDLILIIVALVLITGALILIIFVASSVKRLKQIDGTHKTKQAEKAHREEAKQH